ncbi:hypothetical protein TRIATDRAFT_87506 [Trichoderma atroviride IMI 206040]|uniref:Carbonic anhydrase n=1 Tax=Hypocrea atroviridis (strain ATCC 20476 / IMI 206040) TaxID=452589 RepID=G9NYF7_HYPAI|nr:uncharacterized protein TRIATDRAFT_87506 [Trichoderma atroviride IMI 206040]EHK44469.1 hypothetical protein TRIATDRAFT_87506 [Trichoderma atroviride IMI 206040]
MATFDGLLRLNKWSLVTSVYEANRYTDAYLDFRMEPIDFLKVKVGEAFIIRNAGGSVSNNLADFFFKDKFLQNQLKGVILIHHDDCGVQHVTADDISADLKERFPEHCAIIDKLHFGMHNPDRSVEYRTCNQEQREKDVEFLKDCPFFRKDIAIRGFIYDLKTNRSEMIDMRFEAFVE